jgi:hypothetical protein
MDTGHNPMAGLHEFTVTEVKYGPDGKPFKQVHLGAWIDQQSIHISYTFAHSKNIIYMKHNRPTDVEVQYEGYTLIWMDDPDFDPDV